MRSTPPSVTSVREKRAPGRFLTAISPRDLDYATWHAHIAGTGNGITSPAVATTRRERPVATVRPAETMRPERRAA
jgi:hypothetical protein